MIERREHSLIETDELESGSQTVNQEQVHHGFWTTNKIWTWQIASPDLSYHPFLACACCSWYVVHEYGSLCFSVSEVIRHFAFITQCGVHRNDPILSFHPQR